MNFRHIDQFDYELVALNNASPPGGSDYGDTFSDKALLATSTREQYGGPSDSQTLALLNAAAGEAAGRSIFQKAAMYQGSKASRKILVSPLQQWASWSATPQARRESLQIVARPANRPDSRYIGQLIPPTITVSLVECGSDCVFSGSWQGHTTTRSPILLRPSVVSTMATDGYVWLQVHPHFSSSVIPDAQPQQLKHDWRNAAIFYLTFVVFYREDPVIAPETVLASEGMAGVLYGNFPLLLPTSTDALRLLPETGLYSPDAVNESHVMDLSFWNSLSYTSTYSFPGSGVGTGAGATGGGGQPPTQRRWTRSLSLFFYTGQSFYIAPN